jgi:glutamate 5-kinase
MKKRIVVIKIGSSVIAEPDGGLRRAVVSRICGEIANATVPADDTDERWQFALVTSGAVAMGREMIKQRGRRVDVLQALSAIGQGELFREFSERLASWELKSAQILLTFLETSERENREAATRTLKRLLTWDVIPVINENDTVTTDALTFGDNDYLAAQVATMLSADLLLLLTDADGVFTADPRLDPEARLIPLIDDPDDALGRYKIGDKTSPLGSGGMKSKVRAAQLAARGGVRATICNGGRADVVAKAIAGGEVGTQVSSREVPRSWTQSRKFWLEHGKPASGRIVVDPGAERALLKKGASLLPVGVIGVEGEFEVGDAVEVVSQDSRVIGKGLSEFSSKDLRRICRMQTAAVRELIPDAPGEAISRDWLIVSI